jgi:hypothetical protein
VRVREAERDGRLHEALALMKQLEQAEREVTRGPARESVL